MPKLQKICVVTFHDISEPRGPRHALTARQAFPGAEITFIFYRTPNSPKPNTSDLEAENIKCIALEFPTRNTNLGAVAKRKLLTRLSRAAYLATGHINEAVLSERTQGLTRVLMKTPADLYFAHNIETLLPAARAAKHHNASLMFDCMEYYSDMGEGQSKLVAKATRDLETSLLPSCQLVTTSSNALADILVQDYKIETAHPIYNVPHIVKALPENRQAGLNLYWRNSWLGLGQRGLEDILTALPHLPQDVHLFLQGNVTPQKQEALFAVFKDLSITSRVTILPPHAQGQAVQAASNYQVGLCLERKGPRNHDLTVSNKMFDYHMAGLAVIASNLPGLASVITRSRGGVLYEPGDVASLTEAVCKLRENPALLAELQHNARQFAMSEANFDVETQRLKTAILHTLSKAA